MAAYEEKGYLTSIDKSGNMVLQAGLYHYQEYKIYRCIRNTGNPVYHNLADLVGQYVEII